MILRKYDVSLSSFRRGIRQQPPPPPNFFNSWCRLAIIHRLKNYLYHRRFSSDRNLNFEKIYHTRSWTCTLVWEIRIQTEPPWVIQRKINREYRKHVIDPYQSQAIRVHFLYNGHVRFNFTFNFLEWVPQIVDILQLLVISPSVLSDFIQTTVFCSSLRQVHFGVNSFSGLISQIGQQFSLWIRTFH